MYQVSSHQYILNPQSINPINIHSRPLPCGQNKVLPMLLSGSSCSKTSSLCTTSTTRHAIPSILSMSLRELKLQPVMAYFMNDHSMSPFIRKIGQHLLVTFFKMVTFFLLLSFCPSLPHLITSYFNSTSLFSQLYPLSLHYP